MIMENFEFVDRNEFLEEIAEENWLKKQWENTEMHFIYHINENRIEDFFKKRRKQLNSMKDDEFFVVGFTNWYNDINPVVVRKEQGKIHLYDHGIFDFFYYPKQRNHYSEKDRELLEKIERLNRRKKIRMEMENRKRFGR